MNNEIDTYKYNDEIIYNHKQLDLDFIEANKDCNQCDYKNDYCCFGCEHYQVKEEYPNSKYTDDCFWVTEDEEEDIELTYNEEHKEREE
jgi:hypothetical protein